MNHGNVPEVPANRRINTTAPLTGGDDLYADITLDVDAFGGDAGSGGTEGTVPAPAAGDAAANKFLKADGTWDAEAWEPDRWEDLRFPAQGINPAGSPAPAGVDTNTGCLSFSGTQDNVIGGIAQMPHGWKIGTDVKPHIHLRFPTANAGTNTRWQFGYDVASVNGNFANAIGTYTNLTAVTVANPNSTTKHVVAGLGSVTMTGLVESAIIMWRLSRLANSDAADDDTNACLLMEFDIHFQLEKAGTVNEYPD